MSDFRIEDAQSVATQLVSRHTARDAFNQDIRRAFHMEWIQNVPEAKWIKKTMSPSAHNAAIGAIRLLTATSPQVSVPYDQNDDAAKGASDKIEVAARAMWDGSGRVVSKPQHYEAATSAILFGEICGSVTKTSELVKYAEQAKLRGSINRMRAVARKTPYLFKFMDPSKCYPDFDRFGLARIVTRLRTTWGEVLDSWGSLAEDAMGPLTDRNQMVTVCDYYDWERRAVWVEEGREILLEEHELEFIPYVATVTDGSFLFDYDKPELQRIPLLYSFLKSGLWYRENLSLTTIYSLVYALGSSPLLVRKTNRPGEPMIIDRSIPGGVVDLGMDEQLSPFAEKIIDQSLLTSLDLARGIGQASTIQPQALGAPPQTAQPFSSISLLAQAGRLPLVAHKEMMGQAIGDMMVMAMQWLKNDKDRGLKFYKADRSSIDLSADDIPDDMVINVSIEPDLPQDRLQAANVALMLVNGQLATRGWVRENILNIGQSGQMDRDVWMERRLDVEFQRLIELMKAEDQMKVQQAVQAAGSNPPQGGGPTMPGNGQAPGPEGYVTPEMASNAYPPGGQVGPGLPMQGPVPNQIQG